MKLMWTKFKSAHWLLVQTLTTQNLSKSTVLRQMTYKMVWHHILAVFIISYEFQHLVALM
jgi:hypothetical protein